MAFRELKEQHFQDPILGVFMSQVKEWASQFKDIPFLDGRLIEDQVLTPATTKISHGLGRKPRGWVVFDKNANADIWTVSKSERFLTLDTDNTVTVSIWIF